MKSAARIYFERRRRVAFATCLAEHIVLPCVAAFGVGVLVTLHFTEPAPQVACEDPGMVAYHERISEAGK